MKKTVAKILGVVAVLTLTLGLAACGSSKQTVTLEVTGSDGNTSSYTVKTDAEYLSDAIDDCDDLTIDGYESDWGYYVTTVNGEVADYDADGAYWSIYVDGEYGQFGIDQQPVTDGSTYSFVYEVYAE